MPLLFGSHQALCAEEPQHIFEDKLYYCGGYILDRHMRAVAA